MKCPGLVFADAFVNFATHSTPLVQQNMSTGCTFSSL